MHFSYFNVTKQNQQAVVSWRAEGPSSTNYFLQRSGDAIQWSTIDSVGARESGSYHLTDARPGEGINYYRICAVTADGQKQMSEIKKLSFDSGNELVILYPNPASGYFFVNAKDVQSITLFDAAGNKIRERKCGNNKILIDDLPAGFYCVSIQTAKRLCWQKLVKR